jgi:hypothetical protein
MEANINHTDSTIGGDDIRILRGFSISVVCRQAKVLSDAVYVDLGFRFRVSAF